VKCQKNDRADAEAICEAVQRPSMRVKAVKSGEQQSTLVIHRVRETLVAQKTQLINALRAHLAEFGIVAPQGAGKLSQLIAVVADPEDTRAPALARTVLKDLSISCAISNGGSRTSTPNWPSRPRRTRSASA
jgi:transposase